MCLLMCGWFFVRLAFAMIPSIDGWLDNTCSNEMVIVMFTVDVLFACFAAKVAGNELVVGCRIARGQAALFGCEFVRCRLINGYVLIKGKLVSRVGRYACIL